MRQDSVTISHRDGPVDKRMVLSVVKGILIGGALATALDAATFGYLGFEGFIYSEDGGLLAALIAVCLGFPLNLLLVNTLDALPPSTSASAWFNANRFLEIGIVVNAAMLAAAVSAFRARSRVLRGGGAFDKFPRN